MPLGGDRVSLPEGSARAVKALGGEKWALDDIITRARN